LIDIDIHWKGFVAGFQVHAFCRTASLGIGKALNNEVAIND